jgi:hypothetical protein
MTDHIPMQLMVSAFCAKCRDSFVDLFPATAIIGGDLVVHARCPICFTEYQAINIAVDERES